MQAGVYACVRERVCAYMSECAEAGRTEDTEGRGTQEELG